MCQSGAITHFQPLAFENVVSMNESFYAFISNLGREISSVYGDDLEGRILYQRLSVTI